MGYTHTESVVVPPSPSLCVCHLPPPPVPPTQAAVVLKPEAAGTAEAEVERSIRQLCATKLSAFKVRGGGGKGVRRWQSKLSIDLPH